MLGNQQFGVVRMNKLSAWLVSCLLVLSAVAGYAQDAAQIEAGELLYDEHCASCHGEKLRSSGAVPDLRELGAGDRVRFNQVVLDGRGQMPSFHGQVSEQEFDQLWAYIRSRARNN